MFCLCDMTACGIHLAEQASFVSVELRGVYQIAFIDSYTSVIVFDSAFANIGIDL